MRIPLIGLAIAGLSLSGCAYGDFGYGGGYGSYGYGSPYGSYGYSDPYYYGSGYGYGSPYGWYDNYYYPGTGYYVYDTYRRPRAWTDTQRSYWTTRRAQAVRTGTTVQTVTPNWSGFNRRSTSYTSRQAARQQRQQARSDQKRARQQEQ